MKTRRISYLYFTIHCLIEFICFGYLYSRFANPVLPWLVALVYDFLAFVPQGIIGDFYNRHRNLELGSIGAVLVLIALLTVNIPFLSLTFMSLGNAFIHEDGAIATTKVSEGKLFPSALFVAGGSFGLIFGQYFGGLGISNVVLIIATAIMEVLIIIVSRSYEHSGDYPKFSITKDDCGYLTVVLTAFIVVIARSFIGYAIPISWKKEVWQGFLLFFIMGLGKAMGGYLSDRYGAKLVGVSSTILCIPFLIIGKNLMVISIIGVFLFSLTMSITFGMCLSAMGNNPGLAFGVTTLGLFLGSAILFFFPVTEAFNVMMVVILSLISALGLYLTLK